MGNVSTQGKKRNVTEYRSRKEMCAQGTIRLVKEFHDNDTHKTFCYRRAILAAMGKVGFSFNLCVKAVTLL